MAEQDYIDLIREMCLRSHLFIFPKDTKEHEIFTEGFNKEFEIQILKVLEQD